MTTEIQKASTSVTAKPMELDVERLRSDFPILQTSREGKALVYLDNAATTQKPRAVIDAIVRYYESENANIHRGVYQLSQTATGLYESTREKARAFLNAADPAEIIFTRGTTEGINLVAASWGQRFLSAGDQVVISELEHHSNIVPWQMICERTGAELKVIPINEAGELLLEHLDAYLATGHVKLVAFNHVSNSLGTVNAAAEIIQRAHKAGAVALVDGAQWVAHGATDVQALDADFYVFSGHKLYGPTGIGVLYGKRKLLEAMPPYQGGGDMIESVTFPKTVYAQLPNKFEAGTPDIAGVVGLAAAIEYVQGVGLGRIAVYEHELLAYATERVRQIPNVRIVGTAHEKAAVISFVVAGLSSLDIGLKLDRENICVRTGHHCCQPVMDHYHIGSTARASFAFYNTRAEVDRFVEALTKIAGSAPISAAPPAPSAAHGPAAGEQIAYPAATADSPRKAAEILAGDFEFVGEAGGRDAKNEYVMDMAKQLPALFGILSKVTTRVPGCMSQVYLVARKKPGTADVLEFVADADAEIVRGLIAILEKIYSGQTAKSVLAFDIEAFFVRIGLDQFITAQRRNGLGGMIAKIRQAATDIAGGAA